MKRAEKKQQLEQTIRRAAIELMQMYDEDLNLVNDLYKKETDSKTKETLEGKLDLVYKKMRDLNDMVLVNEMIQK